MLSNGGEGVSNWRLKLWSSRAGCLP